MPTVNGKEYSYTEAGIAAAAAANEENRRKEMPNFRQQQMFQELNREPDMSYQQGVSILFH